MKPETKIGANPKHCSRCGDRYWTWARHAERCTGTVPESTPCDCKPGWQHQEGCVHRIGKGTE